MLTAHHSPVGGSGDSHFPDALEDVFVILDLGHHSFCKKRAGRLCPPPLRSVDRRCLLLSQDRGLHWSQLFVLCNLGSADRIEGVDLGLVDMPGKRCVPLAHDMDRGTEVDPLHLAVGRKDEPNAGGQFDQQNPVMPEEAACVTKNVKKDLNFRNILCAISHLVLRLLEGVETLAT